MKAMLRRAYNDLYTGMELVAIVFVAVLFLAGWIIAGIILLPLVIALIPLWVVCWMIGAAINYGKSPNSNKTPLQI